MKLFNLLLATMSAALLWGALAQAASARNLEFSSQTFRGTFREVRLTALFGTTRCAMTLEGSLHARTITKTAGLLIGYVTRGILGACSAGTATLLTANLPWHVQYASFSGTLPNIGSLTVGIVNMGMAVRETGGITCLVRTTVRDYLKWVFFFIVSKGTLVGSIPTGAECFGASVTASSDEGPVTVLNSATLITLRLI